MNKFIHGDLIVKLTSHCSSKIFKIYRPGFLLNYKSIGSANDQNLVSILSNWSPAKGCDWWCSFYINTFPFIWIRIVFFSSRLTKSWEMSLFTFSSSLNTSKDINHVVEYCEGEVCSGCGHSLQAMPPHVHLAIRVQSDLRKWIDQKLNIVTNYRSRIVAFREILSKFSTDY